MNINWSLTVMRPGEVLRPWKEQHILNPTNKEMWFIMICSFQLTSFHSGLNNILNISKMILYRVSIDLPKVEVRYENLTVDADVQVGTRALPTLTNTMLSIAEVSFLHFKIPFSCYWIGEFNVLVNCFDELCFIFVDDTWNPQDHATEEDKARDSRKCVRHPKARKVIGQDITSSLSCQLLKLLFGPRIPYSIWCLHEF